MAVWLGSPHTAVVVTDHDYMAHFEVHHRVLQARHGIQVSAADERANVAVHKDIPWRLVEDEVWLHAAHSKSPPHTQICCFRMK
jgi:hypothetical protein